MIAVAVMLAAVVSGCGAASRVQTFVHQHASCPAWSPDSQRIAFISFDPNGLDAVTVMNFDGAGLARVTQNPGNGSCPH